ncbi:RipA family octameric membrane protein [Streptomyces tubercidicus]|uniref:RipA family octameric membrane protein n=1 Tax=Streptomyces tubercidicus TaxID=47759 RepID=UPI003465EF82
MGEVNAFWNAEIGPESCSVEHQRYLGVAVEQYKVCLEMADRVSARRGIANSFFLTINIALLSFLGSSGPEIDKISPWPLFAMLAALIAQCAVWFFLIRSYRMLNTAKYAVIAQIEERLPIRAYSHGEWEALTSEKGFKRHISLSSLEQAMPPIFALAEVLLVAL